MRWGRGEVRKRMIIYEVEWFGDCVDIPNDSLNPKYYPENHIFESLMRWGIGEARRRTQKH